MDDVDDPVIRRGLLFEELWDDFEAALAALEVREQQVEVVAAFARAGAFATAPRPDDDHRAVVQGLVGRQWYAVRKGDFDWLSWLVSLDVGPRALITQAVKLVRLRKLRIPLTDTQARILLALLEQSDARATLPILESSLGPKFGLRAAQIDAELVGMLGLRVPKDNTLAGIVARDGDTWTAVNI